MKKLFYLLLIVLGAILLFSCEKEDGILPDTETEVTDGNTTIDYVGGIIIGTITTDINSVKPMYNSDLLYSIPTSNSITKSAKSDEDNYIVIQNDDGTVDTLGLSDDTPIEITGIRNIYSMNDNFLLFEKGSNGIDVSYELLTHEYVTVYDSVHIDSSTTYINIVDTTFVDGDMWLVYYDTLDVVIGTTNEIVNYDNMLYSLTDGTFHNLIDDIKIYNESITYSFNNPFYKNSDKSKFYYLNSDHNVIEVDLSSGTPMTSVIYDSDTYSNNFQKMMIFDDNIVYQRSDNLKYYYITKNGSHDELSTDLEAQFSFIKDDELYFVTEDWDNQKYDYLKTVYDETNDSINVEYVKSSDILSDLQMDCGSIHNIYRFSNDYYYYYFNRADNTIVTISKTDLTLNSDHLDINNNNGINVPIEFQTKMAEFVNGFIIYTSDNIFSVNTNTKSKSSVSTTTIASGYKIKDMTTDIDGNVVFYGKNPSGDDIKGVINSDNTITETIVEYDANGVLITDV